jgi:5'(3')-deoxyribonucleotidase
MLLTELFEETEKQKPIIYMDMDGVQCDFFGVWAALHKKKRYKEIGDEAQREISIDAMNRRGPEWVENFFANLPPIPEGLELVTWMKYRKIPYTILSSPLRFNAEASIDGKKKWLAKYTPWALDGARFLSEKANLAKKDGVANILVDDYKKNINSWAAAGGKAILFRAEKINEIKQELSDIYREFLNK